LFVTSDGALGKLIDGEGKVIAIASWVVSNTPNFKPKRILDIGFGLGHNTLPLAMAFPDAEIIWIYTGIPMLRYGHFRAAALGIKNVKFMQLNAEDTEFESFDWIQTTMFLHETSMKAMFKIGKEIFRMLKPNGPSLHIEQPQYSEKCLYLSNLLRDWDAFNNNEPFWGEC
jgi:ubiquinone/menaquinone biosynthesis C-methylase UbiE